MGYKNAMKNLLESFIRESLRGLLDDMASKTQAPLGLWIYDPDGHLHHIESNIAQGPNFCKEINKSLLEIGNNKLCSDYDKDNIEQYFRIINSSGSFKGNTMEELECHLGLSRLLFPIISKDTVIGFLVVKKYLKHVEEIREIKEKFNIFVSSFKGRLDAEKVVSDFDNLKDLTLNQKSVNNLKKDIFQEIDYFSTSLKSYFIEPHYLRNLLFLDEIDNYFPDVISNYGTLWKTVNDCLQVILKKINIGNSVVYLSDYKSREYMYLKVSTDTMFLKNKKDPFIFSSNEEYMWILKRKGGVMLPRTNFYPGHWIDKDITKKLINSESAVIYPYMIFDGRLLVLGFGFKNTYYLTPPEIALLKECSYRLLRNINKSLSQIETRHLMEETGHLLRRSWSKIDFGTNTLLEHGLEILDTDSRGMKRKKEISKPAIISGLFRLDLIIRNFKAFEDLRQAKIDLKSDEDSKALTMIDVIETLQNIMNKFEHEMKKDGKIFKYDSKIKNWYIKTHKDLFELMLLNLFDNAEKFGNSNTFINVRVRKGKNANYINITNLGTGFNPGEEKLIFKKNYQSVHSSDKRKRTGTGIGLSYCKEFFDLFFPNKKGTLRITSQSLTNHEDDKKAIHVIRTLISLPSK